MSLFILFTSTSFAQIVSESTLWEAKQIDNIYLVRIKQNSNLFEALNDFTTAKDINNAIVQGSGDLSNIILNNEFSAKTKKINSISNVTSLTGNLSLVNGIRTWDLNATLSLQNLKAFTGQIINAKVNDRVELYIYEINQKIHRTSDSLQTKAVFDFTK